MAEQQLTAEAYVEAMAKIFDEKIRKHLRERLLQVVEADIANVIEVAMADLKTTIDRFHDASKWETVVRLMTEIKDSRRAP